MEIGREAIEGWPLGTLYADLLGLSLSTLLLRRYATSPVMLPFVRGGLPMQSIKTSLEFMTDNLHHDLHLAEIASVVRLSPFHFARQGKALIQLQFGVSERISNEKTPMGHANEPVQLGFGHLDTCREQRPG